MAPKNADASTRNEGGVFVMIFVSLLQCVKSIFSAVSFIVIMPFPFLLMHTYTIHTHTPLTLTFAIPWYSSPSSPKSQNTESNAHTHT